MLQINILIYLTLLSAAAQETVRPHLAIFTIQAPQLKTIKTIRVWLPKDYEESKAKYPVIYMHDAQNIFDVKTSFSGEWNVDETLDSLNAQVIVVGIDHGNEKRLDELTPFPHPKHGGGKADDYLDFIVTILKPHIDKTYRTKKNVQNTVIFGSSLGGLTSYYAILKYPKVFGKAGIFSPSFWFSEDIYARTEKTEKLKAKMYFLAGDSESEDMVPDLKKMLALINERSLKGNVTKKIISGGKHNEKLWRESFAEAYLWLMKNEQQ
ncbi:MAG TPA: alpha/beta hydrolase-fold protein [Flavobacterium sp.]